MEQTIPLGRGGKYGTLVVDDAKFSDAVRQHIWEYGLRQCLNDAIADKSAILEGRSEEVANDVIREKAQKRLDALYAGELRVRREAAEPADPIEAEAYRMARAAIARTVKEFPEWKAIPKGTKDRVLFVLQQRAVARGEEMDWDIAIERYLGANPKVRRTAAQIVKDRAAAQEAAADIL